MTGLATPFIEKFNAAAREYFAHRRVEAKDVSPLLDSIEYSLFNGGKRFRPLLCYAVAEALGLGTSHITSFAMAVECVHTYSLIHDDLPCMDDDDIRRGQPTNHKKFTEGLALLAGDSLLTESFLMLAKAYPEECARLIEILSEGSGLNGMIRGQVLDLGKGDKVESLSDLINLHELKTGRLIAMCFEGPAVLADKSSLAMRDLGLMVGLAFQVKDDLLDAEDGDLASFVRILGVEGTQQYLDSLTEKIKRALKDLDLEKEFLLTLIDFNSSRKL